LTDFCRALASAAPAISGGKILGPIPAELYQVRNWFRMRFLVMGGERAQLQPAVRAWLAKVKAPSGARVKVDVAPQSFL
jgi:primosomal protein N'